MLKFLGKHRRHHFHDWSTGRHWSVDADFLSSAPYRLIAYGPIEKHLHIGLLHNSSIELLPFF